MREQILGPIAQGSSEPDIHRHGEAHFGAFEERGGQIPCQYRTQNHLAPAPRELLFGWQPPSNIRDAVVEKWRPRFERKRHR